MYHSSRQYLSFAWIELRKHLRHRRKRGATLRMLATLDLTSPLMIEVGAGDRQGRNGWLTLDTMDGCDIYWDLREGLPFPDASVSRIYSSHFLEHLNFGEGQFFLAECQRVLMEGGEFSICVPNARIYLEAYIRRQAPEGKDFFGHFPAYNHSTHIDYVNYIAYMDGHHKYMFDEDNLLHRLNTCGLTEVSLRDFDPELDLEWRHFESIYAHGLKKESK
jgi:predicted SAM-dependent methyltransferase